MINARFNWRLIWYSVLVWLLAEVLGGFVVLPWYYLALPIVVFWTTVYYFKQADRTLVSGLRVALFWFFLIGALTILQIIGPYYSNFVFYLSDFRNWFIMPLILLIPFIYSLILENNSQKTR